MAETREQTLRIEEIKAIKLFLFLFYTVFLGYDFIYYYIYPIFSNRHNGMPDEGIGLSMHLFMILLLPFSIAVMRKGNPFWIKYMYLFFFISLEFINNFLIYWGQNKEFSSGNVVEVLFILFAPIFVNRKFLWVASLGVILKYIVYGFLFKTMGIIIPIVLIVFFTIFGFILLSRFISYINGMVRLYEDSKQKEKLAVVGQMAASIAHEIKNPLSALKGFTQLQQEKDQSKESYYPIMLNEIDRINLIVSDLLIIGKPNNVQKKLENIEEILKYVVSIIEPQAARQFVKIDVVIHKPVPEFYCDGNQIKQVFINLVKNAVESMLDGGTVSIDVRYINNEFVINVRDEGEGISLDKIRKIGEPFYTTKENGTGLGLMVSKKIIEEHDGKITFKNNSERGANVQVIFPGVK